MEKETVYLIWSIQHGAWWKKDRRGYTQKFDEAGKYTLDDAERIVMDANVAIENIPDEAIVPVRVCAHCLGEGEVDEGEFDDIRTVRCPFCNPKVENEDDQDR